MDGPLDDLCRRLGISSCLACKIYNLWRPVLADKSLIIWLPRETIRDCFPESFREKYPRTTCIIDCAETFIQIPTNLKSRGETYSNYKSHNTAKYMARISPHEQMFISKAFIICCLVMKSWPTEALQLMINFSQTSQA